MDTAGITDLARGFHRIRNAHEDYEWLLERGCPEVEALARTGLDPVAYARYKNRQAESARSACATDR